MSKPFSFGSIDVRIGGDQDERPPRDEDAPFRLLVAGDFGGRAARGLLDRGRALASRRAARAGRDELDDCIARMKPEVSLSNLPGSLPPVTLRFQDLDDLHPDRIFGMVPAFFELRQREEEDTDARERQKAAAAKDILARILAGGGEDEPEPAPVPESLRAKDLMSAVLADPAFRSVEAAWRGVDFLVRRLDTDGPLTIHLLDLTRPELTDDLLATEKLEETALWNILVTQTVETPGAHPWSVLAILDSFGESAEELAALGRLARIAGRAGTAVLAGASARILGCAALHEQPDPLEWRPDADPGLAAAWKALRELPEARFLGLSLPRILLRLPYGRDTEPTEEFEFEELSSHPRHEEYLWGASALAPLLLLAQAFEEDGWGLRPGSAQDIGDLPLAFRKVDGEVQAVPCSEALLTVKTADRIIAAGLMPLLSMKGADVVRLGIFQSVANPLAPLAGPWDG